MSETRNGLPRWCVAALAAVALLILGGCPNPITNATFGQMSDRNPPVVDISSPAANSTYTQTVTVQGTAVDAEGTIKGVAWTVTGAAGVLANGTIAAADIGTGGGFSFGFSTIDLSGPIGVTVEATDWNDNVGTTAVTLASPGNGLSSFAAAPGSKRVSLSWEEVAGATYTIFYTTNGTLPSESYGASVTISTSTTTTSTLTGLKNGSLHMFLLRARISGGATYWSNYVSAIPLSPFSLAPEVTGDYQQIKVSWRAIDATDQFEVYRATDPHGAWTRYSGVVRGTSFTDVNVNDNTWYYYKVRPAAEGSIESTFNGAQTFLVTPNEGNPIIRIDTPGMANRVKTRGRYAFVAAGSAGLVVIDVSMPRAPRVVATCATTNALDIDLDADASHAYIADGTGGLRAIDISMPTAPTLVGTLGSPIGNATAVSVLDVGTNHFAYVLGAVGPTVRCADISTPSSPSAQPEYYTGGTYPTFTDLAATYYSTGALRYVFVTAAKTVPTDSTVVRLTHGAGSFTPTVATPNATYFSNYVAVKSVTTAGDYCYVLGTVRMYLEPPPEYALMPLGVSSLAAGTDSGSSRGYIADVNIAGTKAYAADGIGIQSYDLTAPAAPVKATAWSTPGTSVGVTSNGPFAFVTSGPLGFQSVGVAEPSAPSLVNTYNPGAGVSGVVVRGNLAFVTVGGATPRLQVVDISDPATPVERGSAAMTSSPAGVALAGDYAFVAAGTKLDILDISNPFGTMPQIGSVDSRSGSMTGIAVHDDLAFLTGTGLQVFDVSDPAAPVWRGMNDTDGGGIHGVAARDHYAYAADGGYFQPNGLKVLDMANPTDPWLIGKGASSGMTMQSVALGGDWAFATDSFPAQGLWAVNINPSSAQFLETHGPCEAAPAAGGWAYGVAVFGGWAYVTFSGSGIGLSVIDISSPAVLGAASRKSTLTLTGDPRDLVLSGKYAYIANTSAGLQIVGLLP